MKRLLIISLSDLATDPRVHRQIVALSGKYHVIAAGTAHPGVEGVEFFEIPAREPHSFRTKAASAITLRLGQYERYYWSQSQIRWCLGALAETRPAAILANDIATLPLALRLRSGAGVILDAHEYSPRELEDRLVWRIFFQGYNDYLCRRYLPGLAGMMTVCRSIANEYHANYGVAPEIVMNAPPYHDLQPGGASPDVVRMVHHGGAIPSRRIELMIELMDHLDERFRLDLMLMPVDARYLERLRALAGGKPRVRMVPTVPMRELPQRLNQYDIGLFLLPPANLNYRYALPNKFFEFVQARLAVAIGPSPEMARLTRQYDCGVVADDFDPLSLARLLNGLDGSRIAHYKRQSHLAARELCFERNSGVLLGVVDRVAGAG